MNEPLLAKLLPTFAAELREYLGSKGRDDLVEQIEYLKIVSRCRCGNANCATLYTAPKPDGAYGSGHDNMVLDGIEGPVVLDLVEGMIQCVEILDRDDVKVVLDTVDLQLSA